MSQSQAQPVLAYTNKKWLADAALVIVVHEAITEDDAFPLIKDLDKEEDKLTANAVLRTVEPEVRAQLKQRAILQMRESACSTASAPAWTTFMERFRKGPTVWTTSEPELCGPGQANGVERVPTRRKQLKARDLEYDGTLPVTSYINRLQYLAQSFGDDAVLDELPVALKGDARDWFDSLFPEVKLRMNESLDEWFRHFKRRFQKNASTALQEADTLRHSFDNEDNLTVRQYMTRKQTLYLEAGEQNEELIIRRMHDGLDPTLATTVPFDLV